MCLAYFNGSSRAGRYAGLLLARTAMVIGLMLTLSACAYDSPSYHHASGYSEYSGHNEYRYRNYDRSYYTRDYRSHRVERRAHDRYRDAKRHYRAERHRQDYKSRGGHYDRRAAHKPTRFGRVEPRRDHGHDRRHSPSTSHTVRKHRDNR